MEWTILGLLSDGTQTGYDILRVFRTSPAVPWRSSSGSVYPALKDLVRRGLATPVTEGYGTNARGTRAYEITPTGRAAFRGWFETPLARTLPEATTEVLIRLLFAHHAPEGAINGLLEEYRKTVSAALEQVIAAMKTCPAGCPPHQKHCLSNGQMTLQAQLEWVDQVITDLG